MQTTANDKIYTFEKSKALFEESKKYVSGGSQPTRIPAYPEYPIFFDKAKGCRMWDVDGNEFIDFLCSIGPVLLGYSYPAVDDAVRAVMESSFQSSMNHPVLLELSKKLVEVIPSAELCRYLKTGSEATYGAVRLARYITGKTRVARCGYHGWFDMWWGKEMPGVLHSTIDEVSEWSGNAESLEEVLSSHKGEFAAVILCPTAVKPFTRENFEQIKQIAQKHKTILVFDEIKTCFRTGLGGVQEYIGVTPDITTLSKGMGNGYPVAAVVGKKEFMEKFKDTPTSGTFTQEAAGLTASLATINELQQKNGPQHIWNMGQRLIDGLNDIIDRHSVEAKAFGEPLPPMPRLMFTYSDEKKNKIVTDLFFSEIMKRGVFMVEWHMAFINLSHTEKDIDEALEVCDRVMKIVKKTI